MSDRKAELEKKKAKLQAIREQKERLRKEKEKKDVCNCFNQVIDILLVFSLLKYRYFYYCYY